MGIQLTPAFVFKYEKRMRAIQENEYARALLSPNNWWTRLAKTMESDGASERLTWFLNTARIEPVGDGGNIPFSDLVTQSTEIVPTRYASAIRVKRDQLLDLAAGGLDALAEWSTQSAVAAAYFPQRLISELIMNGANTDGSANAYDGVPFFADNTTSTTFAGQAVTGHPYNPYAPLLGGYVNWLHGSATTFTQPSGAVIQYPGALPIDPTNASTVDVAFNNIAKAIAFAASWRMPDGITPRFMRPRAILCAPFALPRAVEALEAKFIAQAAGSSGGGSGDVEAVHQRWALDGPPIEAQELGAATSYTTTLRVAAQSANGASTGTGQITTYTETITGSDTTWYLVMEENRTSMLGGLIHLVREAFRTNYFFGENMGSPTGIDAILNRALEIEYILQGRVSGQYGHPYGLIRIDAT